MGVRSEGREPRDEALGTATAAVVLLGLGVGGFFDGIVFHQILQWHHMLTSAGVPATSVANLQLNTLADGLFHAATLLLTVAGTWLLWSSARRRHVPWPAKLLLGGILLGWGLFNLVEGIVDHELLGIHHVNETVPRSQWLWWDAAFLVWGAAMAAGGWLLLRRGRAEVARRLAGLNDPQRPAGAGRAA